MGVGEHSCCFRNNEEEIKMEIVIDFHLIFLIYPNHGSEKLFDPRSIAIFGASDRENSIGTIIAFCDLARQLHRG